MSFPDISQEAALPRYVNGSGSRATPMPYRDGHDQVNAVDEANHDYTEGATEKEIQEVLKQHKDEEVAHLGESSTGMGDEGPNDETTHAIFDGPAAYSVPKSLSSIHFMERARRSSISSNRQSSIYMRPSVDYRRSQDGGMRSRSNTGNYSAYSEDMDRRPSFARHVSGRSGRSYRTEHSQAVDAEEWSENPDFAIDDERDHDEAALRSPGLLPRIASAFGFGRAHDQSEEGLARQRSRSIASRGGGRSRRSSHASTRSRAASDDASQYMSDGTESWGYTSNEDDMDTSSLVSERGEGGEEGYSSSLADDTSLPPNSRPSSPPIPLLPSDGIFGDPHPEQQNSLTSEQYAGPDTAYRQTILLPDEDLKIRFTGHVTNAFRSVLWFFGCVFSFGILGLVGRWVPTIWIGWVGKPTDFDQSKEGAWAVVETPFGDLHIVPQKMIPYAYPVSTVFPQNIPSTKASRSATVASNTSSRAPSVVNNHGVGAARDMLTIDVERGETSWEETMGYLHVIDYRYTRFVWNAVLKKWKMIRDWRDPKWTSVRAIAGGLTEETRTQRKILFGENVIDIEGKGIFTLMVDEELTDELEQVLHPFYVFQIASIILWSIDDYYYYAFAITLISAASIISTLIDTKRTIERMREMSRFTCDVRVLIDGECTYLVGSTTSSVAYEKAFSAGQTRNSSELIPGDIYDASDPNLSIVPCDSIMVSGDGLVSEAMLTGESVPVSKVSIKDENIRALAREDKKGSSEVDADLARHYLFAGTKIIRVRPGPSILPGGGKGDSQRALALVTRTGFNTTKGALVRSMLFPKPTGFKFYRDSMRFIAVLAMIAGAGFLVSAVQFIRIGIAWSTIALRALDLITIVVPPALPACLTVGTTFAIDRLRKTGIFCISPNRVNVAGQANVFVFDKTGTLTEDGLDVLGVRTIDRHTERFSELHNEVADVPLRGGHKDKTPLLYALATCHSLKIVDGEILGDPLDIKMFEFTGWTLEEGRTNKPSVASNGDVLSKELRVPDRPQTLVQTVVRPAGSERFKLEDALKASGKHAHFLELGVIRIFDFVSALRRMSVVVKRLKSSSMEIYVKGAPEVMQDICDPDTFPRDYDDMLSYYTRNGFRVIAIAGKSLEGMTWLKAQRMKREQAESGLHFLGFIVFENKLKEATAPAIHALRAAHLAVRMCTGDNVRTAISVARECGLVSHSANVFIPSFASGGPGIANAEVEWASVDDEKLKLDPYTLKPVILQHNLGYDTNESEVPDYQLALTGDVFRWMLEFAPLDTMQRMLVKGVIFARMSPDEKAELVQRLQSLGYTVGFTGDGANDAPALKTADIGISLSEAEASVAAPFTSKRPDISSLLEVISGADSPLPSNRTEETDIKPCFKESFD
ncbi:hypothetical protein QFC22_001343 [Naganishia vaughanmartiniae]|uniref:Uncharacterized protein n=1 Tax=Naganishia vaughanmartiniae TaxID=1424756 RepID=A0ACC2XIC7_9TREE|nr:hypothetical protein QFC22_001343 [Naganishia vaughanmartiniae]